MSTLRQFYFTLSPEAFAGLRQTKVALQWAESLTGLAVSHAADHDYLPLEAHFSAQEISDLTFAVALMNAFNRLAVGMRQ